MFLKCIGKCTGRSAVLCKLLRVGHCLKNHWCLKLGCCGCCCDIFCQVLVAGLSVIGWHFICQAGKFLSCLAASGSTVGILKCICKCFLGGAVSNVFKVGVGGTSGSAEDACGMMTGSCLWGLASTALSVGRFGLRGRCMAGSGSGSSAAVDRGSSLSVMHHSGVSWWSKLNLTFLVWLCVDGQLQGEVLNNFFF